MGQPVTALSCSPNKFQGRAVNISDTDTPSDSQPIGGGHGTIPVLGKPDIVLSAAGDIAGLTPASTVMAVGQHATVTASQDINLLAQRHQAWAVKDGISFFTRGEAKDSQRAVQDTGMKFHAASGNVNVQAQNGPLSVTAQQAVDIQSTSADIVISAPNCIMLNGGGGYIKLEGGNIEIGTNGSASFLASLKILEGGASASFDAPPTVGAGQLFDEQFVLTDDHTQLPIAGAPYRIENSRGQTVAIGLTDPQGQTTRVSRAGSEKLLVHWGT